MLEKIFNKVSNYENPDSARKLDEKMTPIYSFGQPVMIAVGLRPLSYGGQWHWNIKAVREAVEKYQPKLALFGHIHEAYGYLMDLTEDKILEG